MKKTNCVLLLLFCSIYHFGYSQLTTTSSGDATALAQYLAGPGVIITGATITCDTNMASGFFNTAPTGLGVTDGVLLTTGELSEVNMMPSFQISNSTPSTNDGDADLDTILTNQGLTYATNDACALEFDIEVTGDSLSFNYVFSSEEYPENGTGTTDNYVCSINDIFAFFISGPNPAGGTYTNENIALIPGTNLAVSINNVNDGTKPVSVNANGDTTCYNSFSQYYNGNVPGIAYDGSTNVLTASAYTSPCQTYHFKLVIADGSDQVLDSGVFLEAGSFTSNAVVIGASSVLGQGFNEAVEGCVDGVFSLKIDTPFNFPTLIGYDISGTATNGVDYAAILDSVLMPAGDTIINIPINVIADGITEGTETVILTPYTECGTLGAPSILEIVDDYPHSIAPIDTLCGPDTVTLSATGAQFYSWSDSSLLVDPDSASTATKDSLTETTTFYMNGELGTCIFTDTITVYVNTTEPTFNVSPISCPGANDGEIWISYNPEANGPFTYSWPFSPTNVDSFLTGISSAPPGFQLVSITDTWGGCTFSSGLITFVDPTGIAFDYDTIPISCPGANDGSVCLYNLPNGTYTASVDSSGTQVSSYNFTMNNDTFCIGNLGPNTYTIHFSNDTTGCGDSLTTTFVNPSGLVFNYDSTDVSCFGDADGSICVYNITNGNYTANVDTNGVLYGSYNFVMNSDTFCINALATEVYDVSITNTASGCSGNFTTTINEPAALNASISVVGTGLCAGGSIDSLKANVSGGTPNYSYLWNTTATTPYVTSVSFGTYNVIVTDNNNCKDTAEVTLVSPTPMYVGTAQDSVQCFSGNSGIAYVDSFSGGNPPYTYSWNPTSQTTDTAFNLTAGQYIVTVTDINNCSVLDTIEVLEPADSVSIQLASDTISCFGGDTCIDATISGGNPPYSFAWTGTAQTTEDVCGLVAGTYTLTVTDAHLCSYSKSITVVERAEIVLSIDSTNIDCYGDVDGTATISVSGGSGHFTYLWDDASAQTTATATNLAPGFYTVTVTDASDVNCSKSISVNITQPSDTLEATLNNLQNVLCNGESTGSIDVNVNGGTSPYSYAWTNSTTNEDLNNAPANSYTLTVTDANGCIAQYADIITQPLPLSITLDSSSDVSCFGGNNGKLSISVSGGATPYSYSWNNSMTSEDIDNLAAGTYTITVTDSNNCTHSEIYTIAEPSTVTISFNYSDFNGYNVSCNGSTDGSIEAVVNGGSAPYTFSWDNSSTSNPLTGVGAGIVYTVIVTDNSGCEYTQAAVALTEPDALVLSKDSSNLSCAGYSDGTATAIATGGTAPYTYLWSDPQNQSTATATNLAAGTYNCNVTDANGCSDIIQVAIEEPDPIVVSTTMDSVKCWGDNTGEITITASGGNGASFEYSIDNGATWSTSNTFTGLQAGVYNEIVVRQGGEGGCLSPVVSETVLQPEPMFIFINPEDTTVQLQEDVLLNINVDPATGYYGGTSYSLNDITSISWTPTSGLNCTDCSNPTALVFNDTEYTATVLYSPFGCQTSASATIVIENNLRFFIPNSFSPQGDGVNDIHYVYGEGLRDFHISIFNRWGEKVFESNTQSKGWDGTYKGKVQGPGVYTYFFKATYLDNKEIDLKGSITLIR